MPVLRILSIGSKQALLELPGSALQAGTPGSRAWPHPLPWFLLAPLGLSLLTQSFKSEHLLGSSMIPCSGQQQLVPGSEPKAMLKKIDSATFNVCFYVLEIILNTQQHYRFNFLSLGYIIFSWWL